MNTKCELLVALASDRLSQIKTIVFGGRAYGMDQFIGNSGIF